MQGGKMLKFDRMSWTFIHHREEKRDYFSLSDKSNDNETDSQFTGSERIGNKSICSSKC
jgi:hypothetical protein